MDTLALNLELEFWSPSHIATWQLPAQEHPWRGATSERRAHGRSARRDRAGNTVEGPSPEPAWASKTAVPMPARDHRNLPPTPRGPCGAPNIADRTPAGGGPCGPTRPPPLFAPPAPVLRTASHATVQTREHFSASPQPRSFSARRRPRARSV